MPALTETLIYGGSANGYPLHSTGGLPVARLHEIHDCLTLALDATETTVVYTQSEREARRYISTALRHTVKLMEAEA